MQRVEGIQREAVGAVEQMEQLTVQRRRPLTGVLGLPLGLENDEVGAGEADSTFARRFEEENLRLVDVDVVIWSDWDAPPAGVGAAGDIPSPQPLTMATAAIIPASVSLIVFPLACLDSWT